MFRTLTRLGPIGLGTIFPVKLDDRDQITTSTFSKSQYEESLKKESGMERLKMMFSVDEFGALSDELGSVIQSVIAGGFLGACYGGTINSRMSYINFMEKNQATPFENHFDAKKKLQDQVTVGFGRGAFRWAWRLSLFSGSYVGITTAISVYRGKSSLWEYMIAGTTTGMLYKLNHGMRGAIVGAGLGLVLGTLGGSISLLLLKLTGSTMEEIRFWQNQFKSKRTEQMKEAYAKAATEQDSVLAKLHDERIMQNLENLPSDVENTADSKQ